MLASTPLVRPRHALSVHARISALLLIAIILIVAIAIVVFLRRRRREAQEAAIVAASTPVPELSEDDIAWRIGVSGVDRPEALPRG